MAIIFVRWLKFSSFFAGFLNRDVLMYVWDQYVIGLDVAGYHMHFLPAFTATVFILLKDDIMACKNVSRDQLPSWIFWASFEMSSYICWHDLLRDYSAAMFYFTKFESLKLVNIMFPMPTNHYCVTVQLKVIIAILVVGKAINIRSTD